MEAQLYPLSVQCRRVYPERVRRVLKVAARRHDPADMLGLEDIEDLTADLDHALAAV